MPTTSKGRPLLFLVVLGITISTFIASCSSGVTNSGSTTTSQVSTPTAAIEKPQVSTVLDKQAKTVLDQLLQYPIGTQAQVSSAVLTIAPGVSTGLHKHNAPMYVYVLEGTITVTYEGDIVKEYAAGSAILEAVGVAHNGENKTAQPVKLLVVNIGAEGVANSVSL